MTTSHEVIKQKLKQMITKWKKDDELELEIRVGKFNDKNKNFQSCVSYKYFTMLLEAMNKSPVTTWSGFEREPYHIRTYYFDGNIRSRHIFKTKTQVIEKITVEDFVDVVCKEREYGLRFSLKREKPINDDEKTKTVPKHQRIIQRWEIEYDNAWFYHLSKVGKGTTIKEMQECTEYEIELEIKRCSKNILVRDNDILAEHLLLKGIDLLAPYDQNDQRIELSLACV